MDVTLSGRNLDLTPALRDHVKEKLGRLDRYFQSPISATVVLSIEKERHIVEVTVPINGLLLRAEEATGDMYASINMVVDKLERQIRKYKTRINRRARQVGRPDVPLADNNGEADDEEERLVRIKRFTLKPMDVEEAILQMNLLDHHFFVFRSRETGETSVVYRRNDGQYGLIEPES